MLQGINMRSVFLLVAICGIVQGLCRADTLVTTKLGLIKGTSGDGFTRFLGIPYGLVDENNPFGPSVPHPRFEELFQATTSKICPQMRQGVPSGSIDCLTLDIYVPNTANSGKPLPVMVWIHGGAWIGGTSTSQATDPVTLLNHDVIIVSINYRVGLYGFLCLDIPELPGNQGLKDQTLALRWIKNNIAAFGGDDNNITLFGESAGGMSVNMHLYSQTEKLFDKVIIQSGPAISYWMMVKSNDTIPLILAEEFGFITTNVKEALQFISTIDIHQLVLKAFELKLTSASGNDQPLTKPCVEKKFEGVDHFITEHPMNLNSSKVRDMPVIIGHTRREFHFQFNGRDQDFFDSFDLKPLFGMGFYVDNEMEDAINTAKHFYFGDDNISMEELIQLGTDLVFGHSTQRMAKQLLENEAQNVFRYVYSYENASHADELAYLFDNTRRSTEASEEEKIELMQSPMRARLTLLWTNFAKYGNPTPEPTELVPFIWTPITKTTQPYVDMDSEYTLSSRPDHSRMAFWDLFYKLYGKYQMWY
uniref:Carboxylic ester hydrolase n=1 Tax=Heliothis virescens TaxID=7102 RepID=A0A2A4JU71_HELVI